MITFFSVCMCITGAAAAVGSVYVTTNFIVEGVRKNNNKQYSGK